VIPDTVLCRVVGLQFGLQTHHPISGRRRRIDSGFILN
jgi:hypothetical protein